MQSISGIRIISETTCLTLTFTPRGESTGGEVYDLTQILIGERQEGSNFRTIIYAHYHNGLLQCIESTKGCALQRFMDVIPNELRDKIPESILP